MFGLLGEMDDPKRQALLTLAAQMMAGRGNLAQVAGQGLLAGTNAYNQARVLQSRDADAIQQRKMHDLQMQQMQQGLQDQQGVRDAFSRNYTPGQPQMQPTDYETPSGPAGPGLMNRAGLEGDLMRLGPAGLPYAAQLAQMTAKNYQHVKPGESIVDMGTGKPFYTAPDKPEGPKPGAIREVKSGGNILTYEFDGKQWTKIASAPQFAPEKPGAPQLYEGPNGPMWVSPPDRGSGATQVTDPQGNPIPGKKRDQPLTESQAKGTLFLGQMRGAEDEIAKLGQDWAKSPKNQTNVAIATRAKEAGMLTGAAMNAFAGKDAQKYAQAQEQWSEAFLRIKTGAASTRDEVLRNARTFFPQPGDTADVVAQKNSMRAAANKQMEIIAGHGVQQLDAQGGGKVVDWKDLP